MRTLNDYFLTLHLPDIVSASADVQNIAVPDGGRIVKILSAVNVVTAAGTVTLTASINGVAVTGGVVTVASGSAVGEIDSAVPTAANVVAEDDALEITVGGGNTTAGDGTVTFVIRR